MRNWKLNGRIKGSGAIVLAAVVALATVAPGGAYTSSASGSTAVGTASGLSFEAFALALADDVTQQVTSMVASGASPEQIKQAAETHVRGEVGNLLGSLQVDAGSEQQQTSTSASFEMADVIEKLNQFVETDEVDLNNDVPAPNFADNAAEAQSQTEELENASAEEVIAALLALLNGAEPEVMAAIDAAEAAVLALIDNARAQAVAGFAQIDLPELEAFALAQIDMARAMVQQAFDQIRAQVAAAFAEARNRIIEELTGVDFGEALDDVLAEIAAIEDLLQTKLAEIQELLQNLPGGVLG